MPLAAAWVLPFPRGGFASVSREVDSVFGRSVGRSVCGPEEAKRRGALTLNAISPLLSLKRPDRPRGKKEEKKGHSPGRKGGGGPQRMDPREGGGGGDTEKIPTWFCVRLPRGGEAANKLSQAVAVALKFRPFLVFPPFIAGNL